MLDAPNSSLESKPQLMLSFSDAASRLTAPKTDIIIKNGKLEFVGVNDSHTMIQVQGGSAVCFENVIINAQNAYGIAIFDKASLTFNGTSLKASGLAISSNNTESATPGNVVNLRNSLVESTEETALYVSAFAKVNIDRTVLKGKHSALTAMTGEFNVTGTLNSLQQQQNSNIETNLTNQQIKQTTGNGLNTQTAQAQKVLQLLFVQTYTTTAH